MRQRISTILAIAILCLVPTASLADLAPFSQDFEGLLETNLDQPDQVALANDGWLVFGNVFGLDFGYWYGYGPFPAPNGGFGGPAFSAVVVGQGGPEQADQQLSVYSNYNDGVQGGAYLESNVYQEQTIGAADVGSTWVFEFDAKRGDIANGSTAAAFFKTIGANFNYFPADMTNIPDTWGRYKLSIYITPELVDHELQFGFLNFVTNFNPSGMYYDNVDFYLAPLGVSLDIRPGGCPNPITSRVRGVVPAALLGTGDFDVYNIDLSSLQLEGVAPVLSSYEDVATTYSGDLCGCTEAGPDGFMDLTLKFDAQELMGALGSMAGGERVLTLTGTLLDGTPIEGQDCMIYVGGGGGRSTERFTNQERMTRRGTQAGARPAELDAE
jgi:hypothetical protein